MHIATCVWQEKAAAADMGGGGGGVGAGRRKRKGEWAALAAAAGGALNCAVSFVVFSALDVLDVVLCLVYKLVDYAVEAEWKACYCAAAARGDGAAGPRVLAPPGPKVVRLSASSAKMQLEDVSDTLYVRPSLLADATKKAGPAPPALTVSPAIAEMIRGKIDRPPRQAPCWSDCDCKVCHAWSAAPRSATHLYVHVQAPPAPAPGEAAEDVVFIHGFISSSVFWTETVFPAFSAAARGRYRMFAVDLLGFGRSPKPAESLYTLREHVEMIERSVLQRYRLQRYRRRPLPRLRPRPRPRRQVPRRRQVPHPPRAALLPGAGVGGRRGDAVRDAAGGAAAGVAADRVRGVHGVLVRAREPHHLPHHLPAPPRLGPTLQDPHQEQGPDVPDRGVHVPHPQRGVAHPAQHHLRQRGPDGRVPGRALVAALLQGGRLPRARRRAAPRGVRAGRGRPRAPRPRHRLRPQGPHHHHRGAGGALRRRARGHLEERRRRLAPASCSSWWYTGDHPTTVHRGGDDRSRSEFRITGP